MNNDFTNSLINSCLSPITGRVLCDQEYILLGDRKGRATPSPDLIDVKLDIIELKKRTQVTGLPDLSHNKIWVGDSNNRPQEVSYNKAPDDAKYIIQQASGGLPNAQILGDLSSGIVKNTSNTGVLSIASGGRIPIVNDYVRPQDLINAINDQAAITTAEIAEAIAAQAAITTAEIATAVASIYAELLPFVPSPIPGTTIGVQISAAIAAAEAAAISTANSHTNSVVAALSITLQGDVSGTGLLSAPITTTFKTNPQFFGHEYIQIPFGTTAERPSSANIGMLRQNTELGMEYYNGAEWVLLSTTTPPIPPAPNIDWEYATDLVYGVLNNVNGIFNGFASETKNYNLNVQTSYCNSVLNDSSSSSISLIDRYNNGYVIKNLSNYNGYEDYYLQHIKNNTLTNLLKYDSLQERFIFLKPFSKDYGSILNLEEAVDIVTGVLNNVNGIFNGFYSSRQDFNIDIKSSYSPIGSEFSTASFSLLDRKNSGYQFQNETDVNGDSNLYLSYFINGEYDYDLLEYCSCTGEFSFFTPIDTREVFMNKPLYIKAGVSPLVTFSDYGTIYIDDDHRLIYEYNNQTIIIADPN